MGVSRGTASVGWAARAHAYAPYVALTIGYLAIDLWINSRNYVVNEGHYTIGFHTVRNAFDYLQALYVGRRDLANYTAIALAMAAVLVFGNRRAKLAAIWTLLALAPFLSFSWDTASR